MTEPHISTSRIHGRNKETLSGRVGRALGETLGGNQVKMVYTQALVFGNGMSARSVQENLAENLSFLQCFRSDRQKVKDCGRLMKAQSLSSKNLIPNDTLYITIYCWGNGASCHRRSVSVTMSKVLVLYVGFK